MKGNVDQYGYPNAPRWIDDVTWFYETRGGVEIIRHPDGEESTTIKLLWREIEDAVDRHRRIVAARKKPKPKGRRLVANRAKKRGEA